MATVPSPRQACPDTPEHASAPAAWLSVPPQAPAHGTPAPAAPRRDRRERTLTSFVCAAVFTAVQVWSLLVILVWLPTQGLTRVALACVLAGAVMAVVSAWRRP